MPKIRDFTVLYAGWGRLLKASVEGDDGTTYTREIEDHGRAVAVLPYDPERRVAVLTTQFRAAFAFAGGTGEPLEIPAGLLDEDDPEAGARREVLEETGIRLGPLERVMLGWPMPGVSTERIDLYLAPFTAADRTEDGGGLPEENEAIAVHEMPLAHLAALCDAGAVGDLKTYALILTLRLRRPDLFAV